MCHSSASADRSCLVANSQMNSTALEAAADIESEAQALEVSLDRTVALA
jgi:hypothetical protein